MIVEKKLLLKLEELFKAFDADSNGYISAEEICLDNVNADILEIYTPLLLEMEANDYKLDYEEFIESSLLLYQVSLVLIFGKFSQTRPFKSTTDLT